MHLWTYKLYALIRLFTYSLIHLFTYYQSNKEVIRMAKLQLKFVDGVLAAIILVSMLSWWD